MIVIKNEKSLELVFKIKRFAFSFGLSKKIWYTNEKRGFKIYHLIHLGFFKNCENKVQYSSTTVSFLFLNVKFIYVKPKLIED